MKHIHISRKHDSNQTPGVMENEQSAKLLGLLIDIKFNWNYYINSVIAKITSSIFALRKFLTILKNFNNFNSLLWTIESFLNYKSLIRVNSLVQNMCVLLK